MSIILNALLKSLFKIQHNISARMAVISLMRSLQIVKISWLVQIDTALQISPQNKSHTDKSGKLGRPRDIAQTRDNMSRKQASKNSH